MENTRNTAKGLLQFEARAKQIYSYILAAQKTNDRQAEANLWAVHQETIKDMAKLGVSLATDILSMTEDETE
jgi:hypothetical protein